MNPEYGSPGMTQRNPFRIQSFKIYIYCRQQEGEPGAEREDSVTGRQKTKGNKFSSGRNEILVQVNC